MKSLEENIGYTFKNKELLKRALTHTSYAYEKGVQSNEKLEFLGDSILEFISSIYIYQNYPTLKEGEMTKVRATVVCEDSLYKIATRLKFNEFLYLGNSEIKGKEQIRKAILADSVEAVIAAMYLDSNLEEAQRFIIDNLKDFVEIASKNVGMKDYKTVGSSAGLDYVPETNMLIRTYVKERVMRKTGLQLYQNSNMLADIDVPNYFMFLGYNNGWYYGVRKLPLETENDIRFVFYKFRIE